MEDLRAALQGQGAAVALYGLGGVGKTRLAIEYTVPARHPPRDYSALLFLNAEGPERLDASLAALAGPDIMDFPRKTCPRIVKKLPRR